MVLPEQASSQAVTSTVNAIASSQLQVSEAEVDDYVMLSKIDFGHPVFEPMADPQFNDFSKIRFWSHRKLDNVDESWQVVASFDDGDPALIETTIGKGRLLVLASGWQPKAGQLALSTKFIPLVYSLFDLGRRANESDRYTVGEAIDYPPSPTATITGPAGIEFDVSLRRRPRGNRPARCLHVPRSRGDALVRGEPGRIGKPDRSDRRG